MIASLDIHQTSRASSSESLHSFLQITTNVKNDHDLWLDALINTV